MAQQQPSQDVTDTGVHGHAGGQVDADIRDCVRCGKTIGIDEPVCIFERDSNKAQDFEPFCEDCTADAVRDSDRRQFRWWTRDGSDPPGFVRNPDAAGYEPLDTSNWELRSCEVCSRPMRAHKERVCSTECKSQLSAVAARARRASMREAVTPDHFDCEECGNEIEGTVVFWRFDRNAAADAPSWCETCWAAKRTESARERWERYETDPSGFFFGPPPNPAEPSYDPFTATGWGGIPTDFDAHPCGHCGRSIRGDRFCCDRCEYEATKAARRVTVEPRVCANPDCPRKGEPFTPKRSDAMTCSDRCRQALRRSRLSASQRERAPSQTADSRDTGKEN